MNRPVFLPVDVETLTESLLKLGPVGTIVTTSSRTSHACGVCGRKVGVLGRVPTPGFIACDQPSCHLCRVGKISEKFATPYGRAVDRTTLGMISQIVDLPDGQVLVRLEPILKRAQALAEGFSRLVKWQETFDSWEAHEHPEEYARGLTTLLPPRRLDEVLVLRAYQPPWPVDPIEGLDHDLAHLLRRVYEEGPGALTIPF